ncbi:hypothetical protein IWQ61_001571 [Dispira simplex]|nr:hypothetical protein IWQ61_001571 [Dispira simplex]
MSTHLPLKRSSPNRAVPTDDNIGVFGYACRIFPTPIRPEGPEDSVKNSIHHGLVPWQGGELIHNETVWLDRYDIRHLIDDPRELSKSCETTTVPYRLEPEYDAIRYLGLRNDPETVGQESKRPCRRDPSINYHCQVTHYPMTLPETQRQADVIYRTAQFLATKSKQVDTRVGIPLEAVIQAKQSHNPLFGFLHRSDSLSSFYQYMLAQCRAGLAWDDKPRKSPVVIPHLDTFGETHTISTSPENSNLVVYSDSSDHSSEDVEFTNATQLCLTYLSILFHNERSPSTPVTKPPSGICTAIEKTARAVIQGGSELEAMILRRHAGDSKFAFLMPGNQYYHYYRDQVQRHTSPKDLVADSTGASLSVPQNPKEKGQYDPCESSKEADLPSNSSGTLNFQRNDQKEELINARQARVHLLAQRLRAQRQQRNENT